jgi:lipoprotein
MSTKSILQLSLVIVFSISLSACQDAETDVIKTSLPEETTQLHAISTDKALSNLDNFLMDGSTRGGTLTQRLLV